MQQKKILVTTTTFPRWKNDTVPNFVYELSKKLSSKYKIIVLAPHYKGAKKFEKMNNVEVKRFVYFKPEKLQRLCYNSGIITNMKASFFAALQMPLLIISEFFVSYNIIKKENVAMIHAHWMLPQGFIGVFLKKIFRIPLLVTVHGSDLFPLKNRFFMSLQKFVLKNMNFMTLNSQATKNELINRFPDCTSKIKIIPMGIDIELFKKRNVEKSLVYLKNKILLFVGRLNEQKGLQFLIDAMPKIIKNEPSVKLLVIGEGAYKKKLQQMATSKNANAYIEFLGALPHKEIAYYYNIADIFVMPSMSTKIGTEALGLALLEAMASGCAVIGTNVGGIPYIIKNGYNGMLVEQKNSNALAKAIIMLIKDKKKSERLSRNAAEFARKNYSWDKVAKEFFGVYEKILK